jgi:Ca2+/H+ antiporter, TMEM165/GDT1 family
MKRRFWARRIALFILFAAIAIFVFGGVVMFLWNNVLAQATHVSTITFVQALGILVLAKILFGGFRGAWGPRSYYWKQRMRDKWNNMTPEEREKFKQEWQKRCGHWGYKSWYDSGSSQQSQPTSESRVHGSEL